MAKTVSTGDRIKQLRTRKGLLQSDLARHLNVTNGAISNWETNRRLPSIEELKKICVFFDVSLDYFSEVGFHAPVGTDDMSFSRPGLQTVVIPDRPEPCQSCVFLIGAAVVLVLSIFFNGNVQIFLWFFGLYAMVIHLMIKLVLSNRRRQSSLATVPVYDPSRLLYRHPLSEDELRSRKRHYAICMITGIMLEVTFLVSAFVIMVLLKFYLGIIVMIIFVLGAFILNYYRIEAFQSADILKKEINREDFQRQPKTLFLYVAILMSVGALLGLSLMMILIGDAEGIAIAKWLGVMSALGHFVINHLVYLSYNRLVSGYELIETDDEGNVIRVLT